MSEFEVKRKDINDVSVLNLKGYLDAHTASEFESALEELVCENRVKIIVNLSDLVYISSAGLGVFMGFIEDIRKKNGDIKMAEPSKKVMRVFELLGFQVLYQIFDSEQEAMEKYDTSNN